MSKRSGIGLFICSCEEKKEEYLLEEMKRLEGVVLAESWHNLCSSEGRRSLKDAIEGGELTGIIVLCSHLQGEERDLYHLLLERVKPLELRLIKRRKRGEEGLKNAINLEKKENKEKKERREKEELQEIKEAVHELLSKKPNRLKRVQVTKSALVIGGGIAGIQASLDMAQAGFKVYLLEKSPSLGGRMAQLDKTFPTLDCSACILTPKMVDVAKDPSIELLTYTEVLNVKGHIGSFQVEILKKARYVKEDLCTGCGLCATACRLKDRIPSLFQEGIGKRGAIYLPFPQAVPSCYTIDAKECLFINRGQCGKEPACLTACDRGAIDFNQKDTREEISVGSIILATGFEPFSPERKVEYSYYENPQVITGLELERLLASSGPTGGKPYITKGDETIIPKEVAFIQCVGSRDESLGRLYCSRVCCMYTAKQALLLKEKFPSISITIYTMDVRAYGKGFEEFYDQVRRSGIHYMRGNPSEIYRRGERMIIRGEDTLTAEPLEREYDLVVLAVGMDPGPETEALAETLGLTTSSDGFFFEYHPVMSPMETEKAGIYLAGTCQGPKDIPDTIAQAKGAAACAMLPLFCDHIQLLEDRERIFWEPVIMKEREGLVHG